MFRTLLKINSFFHSNYYKYLDITVGLLFIAYFTYNFLLEKSYTFTPLILGLLFVIAGITDFSRKMISKTQGFAKTVED
tara:strand:+ start:45819 stop:46055 length:237 start_codon:yes stop_codon:yes gene_type:complete